MKKCSVCRKNIPAARLREMPRTMTCSATCSGIRQSQQTNKRLKSHRKRVRETLLDIPHTALVPGTELEVRHGHVVGLKQPGSKWQLAVVIRATMEGKAIHACPASQWATAKATADTRLAGAQVAVLPPEWAEDQELAAELEDQRFPYLEDLREAVVGWKA